MKDTENMDWKKKKDGKGNRLNKFFKETGNVRKGWIWATIRFVRFSCHRSCVCRGHAPHSSPWGPPRARCPCLSSPLSVSMTTGPGGCSPCCPGPGQTPLSLGLCSPRCRRRRPPGKMGAGPPAASRWSHGTSAASWGCTASTSAWGCAWRRAITDKAIVAFPPQELSPENRNL